MTTCTSKIKVLHIHEYIYYEESNLIVTGRQISQTQLIFYTN